LRQNHGKLPISRTGSGTATTSACYNKANTKMMMQMMIELAIGRLFS